MTNSFDSSTSSASQPANTSPSNWLKLGAIAAASALVGGLAAAWWYRNTLTKLRQAEENSQNLDSGSSGDDLEDET